MNGFVADLRASIDTLRHVRWLLPVAVAVALVNPALTWLGDTPAAPVLLLAPVWGLVWLGWLGTERVVFARHGRGEELDRRNVWASVQILGPRYARLALLLLPAAVPTMVAAIAWGPGSWSTRVVTATMVGLVAAALTFATPALALSTSEARSAVVIGWRLLQSSWTEVRAHVLVPAVTLAVLTLLPLPVAGATLAAVQALLGLLFRGATTRRYVALVDVYWRDVPGVVWRRRMADHDLRWARA